MFPTPPVQPDDIQKGFDNILLGVQSVINWLWGMPIEGKLIALVVIVLIGFIVYRRKH